MAEAGAAAAAGAPDATIDALRARGAQQLDPVRLRFIEALARRALAHDGDTRRLLDTKLAQALAACSARLDSASQAPGPALARREAPARPGPLAELLRRLDQHAPADAAAQPAQRGAAPAELKALRHFRSTWSQLSVDRQLTQSLAKLPENAGPLNSNLLVLRALTRLRELSPAYLNRFMAYADALLWLDDADAGLVPLKKPVARAIKPARARAGPRRG